MTSRLSAPAHLLRVTQPAPRPDIWSQDAEADVPDVTRLGWSLALLPVTMLLGGVVLRLL